MSDAEAVLRREAARRRLAGESPEAIAQDLGRSRQWVAKWAGRYDPENPGWAAGRSRAPRHVANRTPADVAERVLAVRGRLAENPWAQIGGEAIAWELSKLGGPAVPPRRTIEEILRRAGVTGRQGRGRRRMSKGLPYPAPTALGQGEVVQVDLVGPRHLDGGVRFHALNQIDVVSHHAGIEIITDRGDQRVLAGLHALWGRHGVPRRIQFDNGGPFVSPTGLGEVVRVCLHQLITPVFIPSREPWGRALPRGVWGIKSGALSAVKIGHVYRVRREDVDAMMRRHQGETAPLGIHRDLWAPETLGMPYRRHEDRRQPSIWDGTSSSVVPSKRG